jgi:hypothetical protein
MSDFGQQLISLLSPIIQKRRLLFTNNQMVESSFNFEVTTEVYKKGEKNIGKSS